MLIIAHSAVPVCSRYRLLLTLCLEAAIAVVGLARDGAWLGLLLLLLLDLIDLHLAVGLDLERTLHRLTDS